MQGPTVTIVTPSYNQGHFIRATIESVLSQDYPHVEYIIMDGGSTDQTASVAREYSSRLTFISEKDRGQSHAINKGFQMASGSIVAWLNSDDLYLPGCIRAAVDAFHRSPSAGAVYGEGYLIDYAGNTTGRFPYTEAFNLWKLVHLSDYILQQSVYFRKDVLDDVGYLDENLHYTMDWDVLIRIGMKYPVEFIPAYMGCLREYPEAKSSAGGIKRADEIQRMLQRHTGRRISPGYVVYGLDTHHRLWCDQIDEALDPWLKPVSTKLKSAVRLVAGLMIGHTIRDSQGLYSDGWASPTVHYMLAPGHGPVVIEGSLPDWGNLAGQRLFVKGNSAPLGVWDVPVGEFRIRLPIPRGMVGQPIALKIDASRSAVPSRFSLRGDRRHLAYLLKSIAWEARPAEMPPVAISVSAGV